MTNKKAAFEALDSLPNGARFTGPQLKSLVKSKTHNQIMDSTPLRYLREYRATDGKRDVVNVNKAKSVYEVRA